MLTGPPPKFHGTRDILEPNISATAARPSSRSQSMISGDARPAGSTKDVRPGTN